MIRWPLRARARLTLWYVLLLAATLLLMGGLALWVFERALYLNADTALRTESEALRTQIDREDGELTVDEDDELVRLLAGLDVVRAWDLGGEIVFRQEPPTDVPTPPTSLLESVRQGSAEFRSVRTADGNPMRLYLEPVHDGDTIVGVVEIGRSQRGLEALLAQLRLIGLIGVGIALLLAAAGGYFLAGRALAPVDRITRAAERIGAADLSQRLAEPTMDDEFGRLVRAFNGMIERLDQAFQRQRRFTADASHELRTPLAVIRSETEVALGRSRDPQLDTRLLNSVREESERLGHLVENLLMLARADAGTPLTMVPVDVEELVAEVGARIAPRAREREVQLTVMVGRCEPVAGDALRLTQLLLNLLDNALRHTPSGGQVALSLESIADGAIVRVADSGEGIAAEHLPHLFERFYRADAARGRSEGGTGLGLAICDWIARAHGGRLTVESIPAQGTTVSLWLPQRATVVTPAPISDSPPLERSRVWVE